MPQNHVTHTTSFRAKTDGPNWAENAVNAPNPARVNSTAVSDRSIHSWFVAVV